MTSASRATLPRAARASGFLDGRLLLDVVMYRTGTETWRAWPRSLNMRDATETRWRWLDAMFLLLAQGLPLVIVAGIAVAYLSGVRARWLAPLAAVNTALLGVRVLFNVAISRSFGHTAERRSGFRHSPISPPCRVSSKPSCDARASGAELRGSNPLVANVTPPVAAERFARAPSPRTTRRELRRPDASRADEVETRDVGRLVVIPEPGALREHRLGAERRAVHGAQRVLEIRGVM